MLGRLIHVFTTKWYILYILFVIFLALFADMLANTQPLICITDQGILFPTLDSSSNRLNQNIDTCKWALWPPIRHGTGVMENDAPHLAGTDPIGRDLLACIIHGSRISLLIGVGTIALACLIGVTLGGLAGYLGNDQLFVRLGILIGTTAGTILGVFYGFFINGSTMQSNPIQYILNGMGIFLIGCGLGIALGKLLCQVNPLKHKLPIPLDAWIVQLIVLLDSIPKLILILLIASFSSRLRLGGNQMDGLDIPLLIVVMGMTGWTQIARVVRGQFIHVKSQNFIEASRALGFSRRRIILFHILPLCKGAITVLAAFGLGNVILAESTLSFLGLGPANFVSWGKLLHFQSIEMLRHVGPGSLILPGIVIFMSVLSFHLLGDSINTKEIK